MEDNFFNKQRSITLRSNVCFVCCLHNFLKMFFIDPFSDPLQCKTLSQTMDSNFFIFGLRFSRRNILRGEMLEGSLHGSHNLLH